MKYILIAVLYAVAAVLFFCMCSSHRRGTSVARKLSALMGMAIAIIISYSAFLLSGNQTVATVALSVYYCYFDWLSFYMMYFTLTYTGRERKIGTVGRILAAAAALDNLLILTNAFHGQVFTLTRVSFPRLGLLWEVMDDTVLFGLHLCFSYVCFILVAGLLVLAFVRTPRFYRRRFSVIFLMLGLVLGLNGLFLCFDLPIDISLFVYCPLGCLIYFYSVVYQPKEMIVRMLNNVVNNEKDAVLCYDYWNQCVYANRMAGQLFGEHSGEWAWTNYLEQMQKKADGAEPLERDIELMHQGRKLYFSITYQTLYDNRNGRIGSYCIFADRTREKESFLEQHFHLTHDALTGLFNREFFLTNAAEMLRKNPGTSYYMVCSNIRGFRLFNDLFGEKRGDELLKTEARLIQSFASETSVYGRILGDEFALLLEEKNYREEVFLRGMEEMRRQFDCKQYQLYIQMGVYRITDPEEPINVMCDKCRYAMEEAQKDYSITISYYGEGLLKKSMYEHQMISEFEKGLQRNEFVMYLQPQISGMGRMLGAEALVRWNHPERGLLYPDSYIELLERTGMIYRLDRYMWNLAAAKLREWEQAGIRDCYISVNISAKDFFYLDLLEEFTSLVKQYGINPKHFKLEITETVLANRPKLLFQTLDSLRAAGFEIELDDFGSGYSSLNMLKNMEMDVIKIDKAFLDESEQSERGETILAMMIQMIRKLGIDVVAEGVETEYQLGSLKKMGCGIFQGYYFDKPLTVSRFETKYFKKSGTEGENAK